METLIVTDILCRESIKARKGLREHVKEIIRAIEKVKLRDELSIAIIDMADQPANIIPDAINCPHKVKLIAFLANVALNDIIAEMQSAKTAEGN